MIDVGFTFLYCVLACIQMYILMGIGFVAKYKGILNSKNSSTISSLLFVILIPFYVIVTLSQTVSLELLNTYWILIVNFLVELIVGYSFSLLFHVIFRMDVRIKECFGTMNMIPALGALPLVIGKGFCFPSGPVEGDPVCDSFLGLLTTCLLIYNIAVYILGYIMFLVDKNKFLDVDYKSKYLWHTLIKKFYKDNFTVLYLFQKNIKNHQQLYEKFKTENELPNDEEQEKNEKYYLAAFQVLEENKKELLTDEKYLSRKNEIVEGLRAKPQRLPYTKSVTVNKEVFDFIQTEYQKRELLIKKDCPEFSLNIDYLKIDISVIINKVVSPPMLSVLIGIIFPVSGIRLLVYDSSNNYWSNFVDGMTYISKTYTPLIFCLMGLSAVCANTDTSELLASKIHVIVIMLIRFLIMPFLGMFNVYMWKRYYGGIVEESPAYRLLLFSHWCLPSASNMTLIINMTQYFGNEYGYLILICNCFCIIGLSVLNLIYFVVVGI